MKVPKILLSMLLVFNMVVVGNIPAYSATTAAEPLLAFRGADGGGKYTTGGRGGEVYVVTSLADNPSKPAQGTLRHAITTSNSGMPRTVVFNVSGRIDLTHGLSVTRGNITIAGQTAPGDGICVSGHSVTVNADNVIIRHMRFRTGYENPQNDTPDDKIEDSLWVKPQHKNIMIDHCSLSWSVDETMSMYAVKDASIQWSIIAESLKSSGHPKGDHGYAGLLGGTNVSYHHNLVTTHQSRMPRITNSAIKVNSETVVGTQTYGNRPDTESSIDVRNNVFYNWGDNSGYGGQLNTPVNFVNNYYRPGPATASNPTRIYQSYGSQIYASGNYMASSPSITNDNWSGKGIVDSTTASDFYDYKNPTTQAYEVPGTIYKTIKLTAPVVTTPVETQTATAAYELVLANAGATLPKQDTADIRVINNVKNGTGNIVNKVVADLGGWPTYRTADPLADSNSNGVPDVWETALSMNGNTPNTTVPTGYTYKGIDYTGYTYMDVYLDNVRGGNLSVEGGEINPPVQPTTPPTAPVTASPAGSLALREWDISQIFTPGVLTDNTQINGLTILAGVPGGITIDQSTKENIKIDDNTTKSFSNRLKLPGAAMLIEGTFIPMSRALSLDVAGDSTITVYGLSASSTIDRTLSISNGEAELARLPMLGVTNNKAVTYQYVGPATTLYLYSTLSAVNIYYVSAINVMPDATPGVPTVAPTTTPGATAVPTAMPTTYPTATPVATAPSTQNGVTKTWNIGTMFPEVGEAVANNTTRTVADLTLIGVASLSGTAMSIQMGLKTLTVADGTVTSVTRLNTNGKGSGGTSGATPSRAISFQVEGPSTIEIVTSSANSVEDRSLVVETADGTNVATLIAPKNTDPGAYVGQIINYTGGPTTLYLYGGLNSVHVYYIKATNVKVGGGTMPTSMPTVAPPVTPFPTMPPTIQPTIPPSATPVATDEPVATPIATEPPTTTEPSVPPITGPIVHREWNVSTDLAVGDVDEPIEVNGLTVIADPNNTSPMVVERSTVTNVKIDESTTMDFSRRLKLIGAPTFVAGTLIPTSKAFSVVVAGDSTITLYGVSSSSEDRYLGISNGVEQLVKLPMLATSDKKAVTYQYVGPATTLYFYSASSGGINIYYVAATGVAPPIQTPTPIAAFREWNFSTIGILPGMNMSGTVTTKSFMDDLTMLRNTSLSSSVFNNAQIDSNTTMNFTKLLYLRTSPSMNSGTQTPTDTAVSFNVAGNSTITIFGTAATSTAERYLGVSNGKQQLTILTLPGSANASKAVTYHYTGPATKLYLYATGSGVNLYYVSATADDPTTSTPAPIVREWNMSTEFSSWGSIYSTILLKGLTIAGGASYDQSAKNGIQLDENRTINFSERLKLPGKAILYSDTYVPMTNYLSFDVAGDSKITVYALSGTSGKDQTFTISNGTQELITFPPYGATYNKAVSYDYVGPATTLYLYSMDSSTYVYYVSATGEAPATPLPTFTPPPAPTATPKPTATPFDPTGTRVWNMSTDLALGDINAVTTINGLTILPSMIVDSNTKNNIQLDKGIYTSFYQRLKFGGTSVLYPNTYVPMSKGLAFDVSGDSRITVYALSSTAGIMRSLVISDGNQELFSWPMWDSNATNAMVYDYVGPATTLYLYAPDGAVNIYYLSATGGAPATPLPTFAPPQPTETPMATDTPTTTQNPTATTTPVITATPVPTTQPSGTTITVGTVSGLVGEEVDVDVSISNNTGIESLTCDLLYDNTKLTPISVKRGSVLPIGTFTSNIAQSSIADGVAVSWSDITTVSQNGVLYTVRFKIKDNPGVTSADLTIAPDVSVTDLITGEAKKIDVNAVAGSVNIKAVKFGDIDSNGVVDSRDMLKLTRYLAGFGITLSPVELKAADVYADGAISAKDLLKLAQYLARWDNIVLGTK